MNSIILLIYLCVLSVFDLKEKRVPVLLLLIGVIAWGSMAIYWNIAGDRMWLQTLLGLFPGLVFLIMAWITGKIGCADGIVLLTIGLAKDYLTGLFVWCISLFMVSMLGLALLFVHKVKRHTKIPYIPFLTVAFLLKEVFV